MEAEGAAALSDLRQEMLLLLEPPKLAPRQLSTCLIDGPQSRRLPPWEENRPPAENALEHGSHDGTVFCSVQAGRLTMMPLMSRMRPLESVRLGPRQTAIISALVALDT